MIARILALALAVVVTVPAASAVSLAATTTDPCADPTPHPPIAILGDDDFARPGNGVVGGAGTPADPYVICGWDIAPQGVDGILLKDTTRHVVIRNNVVHDSLVEVKHYDTSGVVPLDKRIRAGVYLYNAENVVVADNEIVRMEWAISVTVCACFLIPGADGIAVEFSSGVTVTGNRLERNSAFGARLRESTDVVFCGNVVRENRGHGVGVYNVPGVLLCGNDVRDNHAPTELIVSASPGAQVVDNVVCGHHFAGVAITFGSHGSLVARNALAGAQNPIHVQGSDGVTVQDNVLLPACPTA
ncbi:MAG TPA: right-handed parallel beta-helix repeat-containing protein [Candidatus Thermoplasmatota archaeon]|nr:right-handed parallel beta-helix repeat-containing protein [Candidatus Thermoplasmatota archaeon]